MYVQKSACIDINALRHRNQIEIQADSDQSIKSVVQVERVSQKNDCRPARYRNVGQMRPF